MVGRSAIQCGKNTGKLQEQGFDGGYSIVKNYVKSRKMDLNEKATVRFETMPGMQGQVDWAFFDDHTVYEDGQWKKLYCFLMILGYSRMRYIEYVTDMSTSTLIRCHINAFRYLGGYPEEILYDNMKQVVIKRLLKQEESTLNRQFEDFAGFYGFKPILCRPYRGQTKGKIERTVLFVRDNFFTGIKYDSLNDLNGQALAWCNKVNGKEHSTTGEIPFERLKKESLSPLTREYIIDRINLRRVEKDCLISFAGNKYSVPSEYVGKDVAVVGLDNMLAAYYEGKQIALHKISYLKKDMIVNPVHYQSLTLKQDHDTGNTLLDGDNIIDFPIGIPDLSLYDEVADHE
jgi:transposase